MRSFDTDTKFDVDSHFLAFMSPGRRSLSENP